MNECDHPSLVPLLVIHCGPMPVEAQPLWRQNATSYFGVPVCSTSCVRAM